MRTVLLSLLFAPGSGPAAQLAVEDPGPVAAQPLFRDPVLDGAAPLPGGVVPGYRSRSAPPSLAAWRSADFR